MDWFTLLPLNCERTGNDLITVKERKQGEEEVLSGDDLVTPLSRRGGEIQPFPALASSQESSSTFPP